MSSSQHERKANRGRVRRGCTDETTRDAIKHTSEENGEERERDEHKEERDRMIRNGRRYGRGARDR
jgi:hypothetical protein